MKIKFSLIAQERLANMASYIYEQSKSKKITREYLKRFKQFIIETLTAFPKAGRPSPELLEDSRKLVYQGYSIIYRVKETKIEVLTLYRENLL